MFSGVGNFIRIEKRVRENKAGLLTTSCWACTPALPSEVVSHLRARRLGSNFSVKYPQEAGEQEGHLQARGPILTGIFFSKLFQSRILKIKVTFS